MVDVRTEIEIKGTVETVSAYASDPDNAPEWYDKIKTVEWKSQKPLAIGSLVAFKAHFLGKELAYTYEIVEWVPSKKMVMKTAEGPFPMETTYTWKSLDESTTLMTLQNRGNPKGFSKWFSPFMVFAMKKANQKDLKKIKALLEK